jgi:carbamoyltransferase
VCPFREDKRDLVPAVVHVDHTGRLQTLTRKSNGRFHELVSAFFEKTGVPMLLNTSFNVHGEPIVETPHDAIRCLLNSGLDGVVFEDQIVFKRIDW